MSNLAVRLSQSAKEEPKRKAKELSMEEIVNRMEGEEESSSDLDITKVVRKQLDLSQYIDDVTQSVSGIGSDTQDEEDQHVREESPSARTRMSDVPNKRRKIGWNKEGGEQKSRHNRYQSHDVDSEDESVDWTEEDREAVYNRFKNRKSLKRKRVAAGSRKSRAVAAARSSAEKSIVGRKPKRQQTEPKESNTPSLKKHNTFGDGSFDEDELMDENLPDYIKDRKTKFEQAREELGEAGLKLPPCYDDIYFSDDEKLEHLKEKPAMADVKPQRPYEDIIMPSSAGIIPAPLAQWLREYQVKGVEFLHELFVWQRGGILGDDMGLGKTIQVIGFLTAAFGKTGDERDVKRMRKVRRMHDDRWYPKVLIICPGGLMQNWKEELDKWGWWQIYVYHGSPDEKDAALRAARNGRLEIMISTYSTYRINQSAINTIDWDCVIADECHTVKSRSSEVTQAMDEVNALCRIGLTGTAIQNKYEELWTLLNWTNPGRFGSLSTWKHCICDPLKVGQAHDATNEQLSKARKTAESLVKHLLPQFFLRRMKTLIADQLPKKSDRVVFCPLTTTQADAYQNFIESDKIDYIRCSSDPCPCESGKKRGWCCYTDIPGYDKWQNYVFPCIITLQKLSNHLALLIPNSSHSQDKQGKDLENLQIAVPNEWKDLYRNKDNIMNYANTSFCGKWRVLRRLLQFWYANGDKVLVFSHSVRLLKMLKALFDTKESYNVSYLDGSMSYEDRAQTVTAFNTDPNQFVFLISTRAGGVGLNITSANKVVVVDPNWNPAYDLQAQDRAYRIGQTRDVEVFRLISAGTIEEIVYARQIYKQQQANIGYTASLERRYFRGVMDEKGKKGEIFGLKNLFGFEGEGVVLRDIVNKTNVAEVKAGVKVIGIEVDEAAAENDDDDDFMGDDDDGNAAMSQIKEMTKMITDPSGGNGGRGIRRKPKGSDAISAILARAGVQYTHENSEVIGSSKIEAKLTRAAHEHHNDVELAGKRVFAPSYSQIVEGESEGVEESESEFSGYKRKIKYRYRPPEAIRKRQFCTMAETFGFKDVTEFALVVEGWTQKQRRNCLEKFYEMRKEKLFGDAEMG
ncbi:hypothetical protein AOQ84DRAFT_376945 [Glonium stellatum]|uniref:DNA excision repair protein n=1 Tax=Glonium stellatum TaxID=574774 RepID=A0A8E2F0D2_9PEZI|nr:hypothetical protein AOQ84DRAFT_376945 [Glonium stellatum]